MNESEYVYVVMELIDGEPNIESYHRNPLCAEIDVQLNDPDRAMFRAIMQYPDRISELFSGSFVPSRSGPCVLKFRCTPEAGRFIDDFGQGHRILPCRSCAMEDTAPDPSTEHRTDLRLQPEEDRPPHRVGDD